LVIVGQDFLPHRLIEGARLTFDPDLARRRQQTIDTALGKGNTGGIA
jgi:hypothetical protein